jgi:hypothetical protein
MCVCVGCVACTGVGDDRRAERTARDAAIPADADAAAQRTFRLFAAWLDAFNSGDRERYRRFLEKKFPSRRLDAEADTDFWRFSGGFDLHQVTSLSSTEMRGRLRERNSGQLADFVLWTGIDVPASAFGNWNIGQPHIITDLQIRSSPRPGKLRWPGTVEPVAHGRISRTVGTIRFSLDVPRPGWENGPLERLPGGRFRTHTLLISKSTVGGQRAEAVIFWTGFRDRHTVLCKKLLRPSVARSTHDLVRAVASTPGTKLAGGPWRVTLGGRPTTRVVLRVQQDVGCQPGFFFSWPHDWATFGWGEFWLRTSVGDTISVWIVDVRGKRLVIEAETRHSDSQGFPLATQVTPADVRMVDAEIARIVRSIRFD